MKKVFLKTLGVLLLCISSSAYGAVSVSVTGGGTTYSGNSVTLKAVVSGGSGTFAYYWFVSEDNSTWGNPVSTASTYTVSFTNTGNYSYKRYYRVVAYNSSGSGEAYTSVTWYPQLAIRGMSSSGINTYSGGTVGMSVGVAGGSGSYTYQWQVSDDYSSWSNVPVGTAPSPSASGTYSSYDATNTNTGSSDLKKWYRVKVSSAGQTVTSGAIYAVWRPALVAGSIAGGNRTVGGDGCFVALTAQPSGGDGNYTYQWQESSNNSSWTDISGSTSKRHSLYPTNSGSSNVTKYYRVKITSDNQTKTSASVYLTVEPEFSASIGWTNRYSISGYSANLFAGPSGDKYSYSWEESTNGSTWKSCGHSGKDYAITKTTSETLVMYYRVKVTKGCASKYSTSIAATWYPSLHCLGTSATPSTTYSGGTISMSAGIAGGNGSYTYQWQVSNDNSSWSNVPSYGTGNYETGRTDHYNAKNTNTGSTNLKKYYRLLATCLNQTITVTVATVYWRPSLKAGSITGGGTYGYGKQATLTANPSGGNDTYSYQWQESSNNSSWNNIANAKNRTYSVSGQNQTKYYRVIVTGDSQTATSQSVSVKWCSPFYVGNINGGGTATNSGGSINLSVTASGGNGSYTYQWQVSDNNSSWSNVSSNGTGSTYAASNTNSGSTNLTKYYRVQVGCSTDPAQYTSSVMVTWRPALVAGSITGGGTYGYGKQATLTANPLGGNGSYTYQWQESSNNSSWNNISYATNRTYSASGSNQTKYYRVVITGDNQTVTSTSTSVTWNAQLVIGGIRNGSNISETYSGGVFLLWVAPSGGDGTYTYQWQESEDNSSWSNTTFTGNDCMPIKTNLGSDLIGWYYRVVVSSGGQTATSGHVFLVWRPALVAGDITGGNITTNSNNSITLTANPSGGNGTYTYIWKQSYDGTSWSIISGETSKTCSVSGSDETKFYKVEVGGDHQTKESSAVSITWGAALSAGGITGATTTYSGGNVTLTAHPSGGLDNNYAYQWQVYDNSTWNNISGANDQTCIVSTANTGNTDLSKIYRVQVTNNGVTVNSASVNVVWRPALVAGAISGGGSYGYGAEVVLTANPSGGDHNYAYQWQESSNNSSWVNISGAAGKSYAVVGYNQSKYYRVVVTGDGQTKESQSVSVTWRPDFEVGLISGGSETTYSGGSVTLTANPSGGDGSYTYQWQEGYDNYNWADIISGGTSKTCVVSSINSSGGNIVKYYRVIITCDGQTKESASVVVSYRPALEALITGSTTSNSVSNVELTVVAYGGDGNYSYKWEESTDHINWNEISSANGETCQVSGSGQTKYFRVKVSGDSQIIYTEAFAVTWRPALVAGDIVGGGSYSYGSEVELIANPSGGCNEYCYQWQQSDDNSSWTSIYDAMNKSYTAIGYNQSIYYKVVVTGDGQTKESQSVLVTWRPELVAGAITGGGTTTNSGGGVTLAVSPSGGNGSYTYQWQESLNNSNWSDITTEGTSETCVVSSINPGNENLVKYYRAVITGDNQTKETQSVTVTYRPALSAVVSGTTETYSGGNVVLSASASGGNGEYSYQWEESVDNVNWNNVSDATGTSCIFSGSNQTKYYRIKVSGDNQTAYAEAFAVTWRPPLMAGTISGGDVTTYSGDNVSLLAFPLGGNGVFAYQWQMSEDNNEWSDIEDAAGIEFVETSNNETDALVTMYYRVIVSGDNQTDVSDVVEITRRPSLKISNIQSVGNSIVYGGDDVNMTVGATGGDGTYSYQWYRKDAESDWTPVGTNSSSFTDNHENNTDASINYQYKVVVSSDSQEKTSDEFQCSWVASMRIEAVFYTPKVSYGAATFILVSMANGSGIYDYQWQSLVNGEWYNIPDNDDQVLAVPITVPTDYRCVVTDSLYPNKSVTTDVISIDVWPDLTPGTTPTPSHTVDNDSIAIGGGTPSGGDGVYHYRWEKRSADDNGVFVRIADTTPTIGVLPKYNTTYRRYDISGSQEKLAFEIQVNVPLTSGTIAVDGNENFYYAGRPLPLIKNIEAASGGDTGESPNYQWYWKMNSHSSFTPISGATGADYQPENLTETTLFFRAVIDGGDVRNSNQVKLEVIVPDITVADVKERYCKGDDVSISASGVEGCDYKWFDASGWQIGYGANFNLLSIEESTTLTLRTYFNADVLNEKKITLTVVEMNPDFGSDQIIVNAGDVVHFTNSGSDFAKCEWNFGDGADGSFETDPWHYYNEGGSFSVTLQLTSREGCVAESTKNDFITVREALTDVTADRENTVSVYPNPAADFLMVEVEGESRVIIVSSTGAVVFETTVSSAARIDISAFPEGTYTVIVAGDNGDVHQEEIVKY